MTTAELLAKYKCPMCGDKLFAPAADNHDVTHWQDLTVWCCDMGHWAGRILDCDKA